MKGVEGWVPPLIIRMEVETIATILGAIVDIGIEPPPAAKEVFWE